MRAWWWRALVVLLSVLWASAASAAEVVPGPYYYSFAEDDGAWLGAGAPPWQSVAMPRQVPNQASSFVWIAVQLPENSAGQSVLLPPVHTKYAAYLGASPLARDESALAGARAFHLIDLPETGGGRWLRLRIESDYSKTGLRGEIRLGAPHELVQGMLRRDIGRAALIVVFLLGGFASLGVAIRGVDRRAFLGFGIWLLSTGIWSAFYTEIRDLLLPSPGLWLTLWATGLGGVGVGFIVFFAATFAPDKRWVWRLIPLNAAVAVAGLALLFLDVPTSVSNPFLAGLRLLYLGEWCLVMFVVGRQALRGVREAQVWFVGLVLVAAFSIRDLLLSLGVIASGDTTAHWGSFGLFVASGVVLQRRLAALRNERDAFAAEAVATARERELLLRDLHDGLGRITTTISMLSASPRKTDPLPTIRALADEGNREIRALMQALDAEEVEWTELEAQIRLAAQRCVQASGGSTKVRVQVNDADPPGAFLYIQVLRVVQEALTNVSKHGATPHVDVTLEVSPRLLTLRVVNDGVTARPGDPSGVNLGAGMGSMRARAEELGGELRFSLDPQRDEARLELLIPLPIQYADPVC